jgi:hypothetical protein
MKAITGLENPNSLQRNKKYRRKDGKSNNVFGKAKYPIN